MPRRAGARRLGLALAQHRILAFSYLKRQIETYLTASILGQSSERREVGAIEGFSAAVLYL